MRTLAAGAVVKDDAGRILLVRRARPPEAGRWTVPGGRVEAGETLEQAAAREVWEETGLRVRVERELWALDLAHGPDVVYEIHDFLAHLVDGDLVAGDDAAEVGWFTTQDLATLPLTEDLAGYLTRAGML